MSTANDYIPERFEFAVSRIKRQRQYPPIGCGCYIGPDVYIGRGTIIRNNVVISGNVQIGDYCLIKSNTVIGEKGFSFGFDKNYEPYPIAHTGGVIIGNRVEIGALCTVAGGTINPNVIESHVKIDDHVHIAHNCHIGEKTIIAAGATLSGGVTTGKACWIGLHASIINKAVLADRTLVGMGANVVKDSNHGDVLVGNPAKAIRSRE